MEKSTGFLIGGTVIVIIAIIAVSMTGAGTSAHGSRPGYGQGQPAAAGQGQGSGPGAVSGAPVLLPQPDMTPLTGPEIAMILFMREEEQMAHDAYARWAERYTIPIFSTIAASETIHTAEVQLLIDRYGLGNHRIGDAATGYSDPVIQALYSSLSAAGDASLSAALNAGLAIEERDIADLDMALANTTRADIRQVYSSLRQGSENHKSAFLRQLGR